jgi:hypothetical protein
MIITKIPLLRPWCGRDDNFEMKLSKMFENVDWIEVPQDMVQWQAVLRIMADLCVPQQKNISLPAEQVLSFKRSAQRGK